MNYSDLYDTNTRTPNRVYLTETDPENVNIPPESSNILVCENTQIKLGIKITIKFPNIVERNCPLRTQE